MKNSKGMAVIYWGISMVACVTMLALSQGALSGVVIVWLIGGTMLWKRGVKKERVQEGE